MFNQRISPLQIGQYGMSNFGGSPSQSALRTKFQDEAMETPVFSDPRFPGFSQKEVERLEDETKDLPPLQKMQAQQSAYAEISTYKKYEKEQKERQSLKNKLYQDAINEKDKTAKILKMGEYRLAEFADMIRARELENLGQPIFISDEEILQIEFEGLGESKGYLFTDFLDGKSNDLLYEIGLMERPEVKEKSFGDKAKDSIVGPYVRAVSGLIGAPAGAIKGLIGAVTDENGHMKDFFQQVMEDNTSNVQKALEFTFGGLARVVGGTVGGTIGGALEGLFKGSTTEEERDDLLGKLGTAVQLLAESDTGEVIMDFWENNLTDAEKRGFGSLLEGLNVVGIDALFTKAGKQAMKEIGKYAVKTTETLGDIGAGGAKAVRDIGVGGVKAVRGATEKATTAVRTYADDLAKMAGREAPSAKRAAKLSKEADDLVEKIAKPDRGDTPDVRKSLKDIETKGVKTFEDLGNNILDKANVIQDAKRKILKKSADKLKYTPTENSVVETVVAGEKVSQNFIEEALDGLEELVKVAKDGELAATIRATRAAYQGEGLSAYDVDNLSAIWRKYRPGFNLNGQPSTAITKIGYNNIRDGLKQTFRKDVSSVVKELDIEMSNMLKAKDAIDDMAKTANKVKRTMENPNIVQKLIGRGFDAADYISFGGLTTLARKLGNKGVVRLNEFQIQEKLPKLLKELNSLENKIKKIPATNKVEGKKAVDALKLLQDSLEKNLIKAQSTTKPTKVATS